MDRIIDMYPHTIHWSTIHPLRLRFWLFLLGCIGSRTLFTISSYYAAPWLLRLFGMIALFPVMGWFYFIFIGKRDTGIEVLGDRIWWKSLRPIHLSLWALFAWMALQGNSCAWIVLAIDTAFGLLSFLMYHGYEGELGVMIGRM